MAVALDIYGGIPKAFILNYLIIKQTDQILSIIFGMMPCIQGWQSITYDLKSYDTKIFKWDNLFDPIVKTIYVTNTRILFRVRFRHLSRYS